MSHIFERFPILDPSSLMKVTNYFITLRRYTLGQRKVHFSKYFCLLVKNAKSDKSYKIDPISGNTILACPSVHCAQL